MSHAGQGRQPQGTVPVTGETRNLQESLFRATHGQLASGPICPLAQLLKGLLQADTRDPWPAVVWGTCTQHWSALCQVLLCRAVPPYSMFVGGTAVVELVRCWHCTRGLTMLVLQPSPAPAINQSTCCTTRQALSAGPGRHLPCVSWNESHVAWQVTPWAS